MSFIILLYLYKKIKNFLQSKNSNELTKTVLIDISNFLIEKIDEFIKEVSRNVVLKETELLENNNLIFSPSENFLKEYKILNINNGFSELNSLSVEVPVKEILQKENIASKIYYLLKDLENYLFLKIIDYYFHTNYSKDLYDIITNEIEKSFENQEGKGDFSFVKEIINNFKKYSDKLLEEADFKKLKNNKTLVLLEKYKNLINIEEVLEKNYVISDYIKRIRKYKECLGLMDNNKLSNVSAAFATN